MRFHAIGIAKYDAEYPVFGVTYVNPLTVLDDAYMVVNTPLVTFK